MNDLGMQFPQQLGIPGFDEKPADFDKRLDRYKQNVLTLICNYTTKILGIERKFYIDEKDKINKQFLNNLLESARGILREEWINISRILEEGTTFKPEKSEISKYADIIAFINLLHALKDFETLSKSYGNTNKSFTNTIEHITGGIGATATLFYISKIDSVNQAEVIKRSHDIVRKILLCSWGEVVANYFTFDCNRRLKTQGQPSVMINFNEEETVDLKEMLRRLLS